MAAEYWNERRAADRKLFLELLAPIVAASNSKAFDDEDGDAKTNLTLWVRAFTDVPRDIVAEACARYFRNGVRFLPKHGELKDLCRTIIDERRTAAAVQARAQQDACRLRQEGICLSGYVENEQGAMVRCDCHVRGVELMRAAPAPLERLQLAERFEGDDEPS